MSSVQNERVESSGANFSVWLISSNCLSTTAFVIDSEGVILPFPTVGGVLEEEDEFLLDETGLRVRLGDEGMDSDGESGNSEGETALEVSLE